MVEEYQERRARQERIGTWPARPTCPRRIQELRPGLSSWLTDYVNLDKHGILPDEGGYNDQGARFDEAMSILRREFNRDKS